MAEQTGISWCHATFNPWVGCEKVSPGCAHCYAETLVQGRMDRAGTWGPDGVRQRTAVSTWKKPVRWNRLAEQGLMPDGSAPVIPTRPRVFCASLADVFEPRPELDPWRHDLFDLIAATPALDWLVLTKRPEVAADWLHRYYVETGPLRIRDDEGTLWTHTPSERDWTSRDGLGWGCLPNLWIGTSIENTRFTWRADELRRIPATVRFISAEPLLGSLFTLAGGHGAQGDPVTGPVVPVETPAREKDSRPLRPPHPAGSLTADDATERGTDTRGRAPLDLTGIDWVIVGGESGGPNARPPHPEWIREIWRECTAGHPWGSSNRSRAGMPLPAFHFKQWGAWRPSLAGGGATYTRVTPEGRQIPLDDVQPGSEVMRYCGASSTAGGKGLDGVDWCEFPWPPVAVPA